MDGTLKSSPRANLGHQCAASQALVLVFQRPPSCIGRAGEGAERRCRRKMGMGRLGGKIE